MNKRKTIIMREFETLGYDERADRQIGQKDFEEIRNFVLTKPEKEQYVLAPRDGVLKARNFVGVIQTRRGAVIEILPKIDLSAAAAADDGKDREIFLKMLRTWRDGPCRNLSDADVRTMKNFPLFESFITMFLKELLELTRRGLARSYDETENNLHVLKGKLILAGHLRYNLAHRERFYVRYGQFSTNRPVNRLLKSALLLVCSLSQSASNRMLIRQASFCLEDVPASKNVPADLIRAKVDRTMPLYARPFAWARLLLENAAPATYRGPNPAVALLFPMERIFESYVAHRLRRELGGWKIRTQESPLHLVEKNPAGRREFRIRPDVVARKHGHRTLVMDVKWKRLSTRYRHCGISQSDLYQLYAYGKKYAAREPRVPALYLLYPWNNQFTEARRYCYETSPRLELEVRPVRLDDDRETVLKHAVADEKTTADCACA